MATRLNFPSAFFFKHAGWSYDPKTESPQRGRWRGAKQLARAEAWAQLTECTFEWKYDDDPDLSWMSEEEQREEHEILGCILRSASGEVLESLWGITDPDRNYRRVIEAELALEAMPTEADLRLMTQLA